MAVPEGSLDVHVHAGPSLWTRKHDAIELAERVRGSPLDGIVLKSHFGNTYAHAGLARTRVPAVEIHSSVTLNSFVGGFNPTAVEFAIETGASVVWLPTFSAANAGTGRHFPFSDQSLSAVDDDGALRPAVHEVLRTVDAADRRVVVGTGHLSRAETFAVLDAIEDGRLDVPYMITHADADVMGLSVGDQIALADRGAVIEKCYRPVVTGQVSIGAMAESVGEIGPARCVLSTDHGQPDYPSPPDAYVDFVEELRDHGVDAAAIERMGATGRDLLPDAPR